MDAPRRAWDTAFHPEEYATDPRPLTRPFWARRRRGQFLTRCAPAVTKAGTAPSRRNRGQPGSGARSETWRVAPSVSWPLGLRSAGELAQGRPETERHNDGVGWTTHSGMEGGAPCRDHAAPWRQRRDAILAMEHGQNCAWCFEPLDEWGSSPFFVELRKPIPEQTACKAFGRAFGKLARATVIAAPVGPQLVPGPEVRASGSRRGRTS